MHPSTEAPPRTPSTDNDVPLLQQRFRHAELDRHDEQPPDAVAVDVPYDERRLDPPGDIHRDDHVGTTPGDGPATLDAAIWAEGSVQELRDRWREAQLRFVDDPRKAAADTRNLVDEAVEALTAALASHREQLNSLPTNGDTEQYRVFVQRSRTFFERLLTL
jgi:hypothetical protein